MFTGLSAFPLTPFAGPGIDHDAYGRLIARLADAGVGSITALGSTGSYMYLDRAERQQVLRTSVECAGEVPVFAGIGALRTEHVLQHAEDAQAAGAMALLLAPVAYQPLSDQEVYRLFEQVSAEVSVPLVLYDNPGTTGVQFTDELYGAIAALPAVRSIKIPPLTMDGEAAAARIAELKAMLPDDVALGISGDPTAARALTAGCDLWYSVIGGTLPRQALALLRAASAGDRETLAELSESFGPLWDLFARHGSLRPTAAAAEELGLVEAPCLPRPLIGLSAEDRPGLRAALARLDRL